ncbi:MAG: response regulator [Promethearchaeota archaeon]|jgi:two-component system chemotaxis response regulator CheY
MKKKNISEKFSVLIVDDATFVRKKLIKIVEKMDFAEVVGEATNGVEAISLYKKLKPDLVTMDLVMPNLDGIQAIEDIMTFDRDAKIVVVSAMGQDLSIKEAVEKGAKEYIKKPFKEDEVYTVIERLLK